MALNNDAVILPGKGTVLVAPVGTPLFDVTAFDLATPTTYTGWDLIGHTSTDNAVALNRDGGDSTQRGSWWTPALRTSFDPSVWSMTVNSLQVDTTTLSLAFGGGTATAGKYAFPSSTTPVDKAVVVLAIDTTGTLGWHMVKGSCVCGDPPSFDPTAFFEIQLSITANEDDSGNFIEILFPTITAPA